MNLTEPQAGSDLAAIRTRAAPEGDHYRIFGQKIFITYGEHDLTPNIVHLVLARIDGAPAGVKGISLFVVPEVADQRRWQSRRANDVRCVSIEHKLGIHASPTCVMAYGDRARRDRLPDRRAAPRPRIHVHHDELRAPRRSACRASGWPSAPAAGAATGRATACRGVRPAARAPRPCHRPPPRRAAHAADDEGQRRGDARAGAVRRVAARSRARGDRRARARAPHCCAASC